MGVVMLPHFPRGLRLQCEGVCILEMGIAHSHQCGLRVGLARLK